MSKFELNSQNTAYLHEIKSPTDQIVDLTTLLNREIKKNERLTEKINELMNINHDLQMKIEASEQSQKSMAKRVYRLKKSF